VGAGACVSVPARLFSPVILCLQRVNSSSWWELSSKVLLVQRNMIKLGPFVFACVLLFFFFKKGTCVGRAARRAWQIDGQILTILQSGQRCLCPQQGWDFRWKGQNWSRVRSELVQSWSSAGDAFLALPGRERCGCSWQSRVPLCESTLGGLALRLPWPRGWRD